MKNKTTKAKAKKTNPAKSKDLAAQLAQVEQIDVSPLYNTETEVFNCPPLNGMLSALRE